MKQDYVISVTIKDKYKENDKWRIWFHRAYILCDTNILNVTVFGTFETASAVFYNCPEVEEINIRASL